MWKSALPITLLIILGCNSVDGPTAPPAPAGSPAGGLFGTRVGASRARDAGAADAATDTGAADAATDTGTDTAVFELSCLPLTEGTLVASGSLLSLPRDVSLDYVFSGFSDGCRRPTIKVGLSSACDTGMADTYVAISIELESFADGNIVLGPNAVTGLTSGVAVEFVRTRADGTEQRFGSCAGVAGNLSLSRLDLNVDPSPSVALAFDLEVDECGAAEPTSVALQGVLDVPLASASSYSERCPEPAP